jgi:transcription antitermination factor NusG
MLYSQTADQQKVKTGLEAKLEGTDSEVFIPCMEFYKRGEKAVKIKPVFPNYVFIYTNVSPMELHKMIRNAAREISTGVRELGFKEQCFGETIDPDITPEEKMILYPNVSEAEAEFLDFLREGNGLLKMSAGYEEGKKFVVMEGPLKAYEDKIKDVDKHNRKAFLAFEINGSCAQAGFECKPKSHWFPKEDAKLPKLDDGTEVDLEELRRNIMKI